MSTKVTVDWTFGNFDVTVEAEVSEEQVTAMLKKGVLQVLQRTPATKAEQAVAGDDWEVGKKGGLIRPDGFERSSIPFTQENANRVAQGFGTSVKMDEGGTLAYKVTRVVEHVGGDISPMKMATQFVDALLYSGKPETAAKLREMLGLFGMAKVEEASRDEMIEFAHAKGLGISTKRK